MTKALVQCTLHERCGTSFCLGHYMTLMQD